MKIIEILQKYAQGLIASGNALLFLCRILLIIIGFGFASIVYIFKIGFKLFIIFLDEALYFSIKGLHFLEKCVQSLRTLLIFLLYYFIQFIENLNLNIEIPEKPEISENLFFIFPHIFKSLFYYLINFLIILISLYWLLTYIEIVSELSAWILSIFSTKLALIDYLNEFFKYVNNYIFSIFNINIFDRFYMWIIRIIAFLLIFLFRYVRLKKEKPNLTINSIFTFKKDSHFWNSKSTSTSNKKRLIPTIILFLAISFGGTFYYLYNNENFKSPAFQSLKKFLTSDKDEPATAKIPSLNTTNILAQIEGQEYEYAIELINKELENQNITEKLKNSLTNIKAYIEAKEYDLAIENLLNITKE